VLDELSIANPDDVDDVDRDPFPVGGSPINSPVCPTFRS
jgi:hypothetical protein